MKLVITGGHHSSALPVIKKLREKKPDVEISWFGHKHTLKGSSSETLEFKEISELNIPFYDLKAGKLYKTFDPVRLAKVPFGVVHAVFLLNKIKPDLILSFGGYLAAPTVIAGWLLGVPSLTHEQTVTAGYSNKLIARFAKKILVSWPQSAQYYPSEKVVNTGIPLRQEIYNTQSNNFEINLNLPTVYITGGKTGSHKINLAVLNALEELLMVSNVIHQTGAHSEFKDIDALREKYKKIESKVKGRYIAQEFILGNEVGEAYKKADVVVSRSGAHTIAEILALEKPAVLIPIPWVSHNEQMENSKIVEKAGLGTILEEKNLSGENLFKSINEVLGNKQEYILKNQSFKQAIALDSAELIVDEILKFE